MSDTIGGIASVVSSDGFEVESNSATAESVKANFDSEAKPGEAPKDEEAETREAAAKLGKKGGEAAAKARAEAKEAAGDDEKAPDAPEAKEPEKKAVTEDEDGKAGNPRHDAKARIQQLARERAEEKAKRVELEARLAKIEAERAPAKPEAEVRPAADGVPQEGDFATYAEYVEAVAEFKAEQKLRKVLAEAESRQRADQHAAAINKRMEAFDAQIAKSAKIVRDELGEVSAVMVDGREVDSRLLGLTPTFMLPPNQAPGPLNDIAEELINSEAAPQLFLYLTEHPEEMGRLTRLPNAREIQRAILRLESKVTGSPAPPPPPAEPARPAVSQAHPPVRTLPGSTVANDDVDGIEDFDAYVAKANARDAKLRRVR